MRYEPLGPGSLHLPSVPYTSTYRPMDSSTINSNSKLFPGTGTGTDSGSDSGNLLDPFLLDLGMNNSEFSEYGSGSSIVGNVDPRSGIKGFQFSDDSSLAGFAPYFVDKNNSRLVSNLYHNHSRYDRTFVLSFF